MADIDLGGFDAAADRRLSDYFVTTSYARDLSTGPGTLFLGRKGSGKSALFDQLPRLLAADDPDLVLIRLTPDHYAWAALKGYAEEGLAPEQAHTNAWKLTIATEIAAGITALTRKWSKESSASLGHLGTFVRDNFGELSPSPHTKAFSLLKSISSLDITALGLLKVGITRGQLPQTATPPISAKLTELLTIPLREIGVVVGLDRLDESWDGSTAARSSLVGLLQAAKELNDSFGLERGRGLRVITFLRSDIYDSLEFDDKGKHRQAERQMLWTMAELHEMLNRRLPPGLTVDELFEPGGMGSAPGAFAYVASRTFLHPREILEFVDASIQEARHVDVRSTLVTRRNIRAAEMRYGAWVLDDLKQEYRRVYPVFGDLLECLRGEPARLGTVEEAIELLTRKAPREAVLMYSGRGLLQMLFEASAIGVRTKDTGVVKFKSHEPMVPFPSGGQVFVHPALFSGLGMAETSRRAKVRRS